MNPKDELKHKNWTEHLVTTKEKSDYSQRRMDLLIISICGGAIYILLETVRELKTNINETIIEDSTYTLLYITGMLLLSSILVNFLSQISGYHANKHEEEYIQLELNTIENKKKKKNNEKEQKIIDKKKKKYDMLTSVFNLSSIVLMFLGVGFLMYSNYFIF